MKTTPISSPHAIQQSGSSVQSAQDARSRAIAKLTPAPTAPVEGQSAPTPVDANNISVEDLSALKQSSSQNNTSVEVITEAVKEEPKAAKPGSVETPSSQMAILARKERALRAKAQQQDLAYKAREEALKAREAALASKDQEYQSGYISKQRIKQDLAGVMAEEGLSYDELTQQMINQQPENPRVKAELNRLAAQNKALEEKIASFERNSQEQQTGAYKAALNQIRSDVTSLVKSEPDAYEAIIKTGSINDVVDLIEETFKKDKRVMSTEEAAQEVENYLADEAYKLSELKKVQKRRQSVSTTRAPTQAQTPGPQKQPQTMKTLTNATSSTRQLSAKERAVLAFKGELKS